MRFELTTLTLARLCSTPELRPHSVARCLAMLGRGCKRKFCAGLGRVCRSCRGRNANGRPEGRPVWQLERAMRFELTTLTLARLCSTPELRPHPLGSGDL